MDYILDTSALIAAWGTWYRPENMQPFWNGIEEMANNSRLAVPDAVLQELSERESELYKWCKKREKILVKPSDDSIQDVVKYIEKKYPGLKTASMPAGKNFADPFVIAMAKVYEAKVVQNEGFSGNLNGPKIGDVCRAMGIDCIQVHRIIREENWIFTRS